MLCHHLTTQNGGGLRESVPEVVSEGNCDRKMAEAVQRQFDSKEWLQSTKFDLGLWLDKGEASPTETFMPVAMDMEPLPFNNAPPAANGKCA